MLTGKRPFDGEDVSDTLANVLKIDPDWSALPSEIPPAHSNASSELSHQGSPASCGRHLYGAVRAGEGREPRATGRHAVGGAAATQVAVAARRGTTVGALVVAVVATTLTWVATRPAARHHRESRVCRFSPPAPRR